MGNEIVELRYNDGDTITCYNTFHAFQIALKTVQDGDVIIERSPTMNCVHNSREDFIKYLKKYQIHNQVINYGRNRN